MASVYIAALRVAVVSLLLLASGCAMYGHALRDVDLALQQGRPEEALLRLEGLGRDGQNEALYHIHRGALLRAAGNLEASIAAFEAAKPLMTWQEATSVSETAGQLMLAEGTTSYQPRLFERLQLHVQQALNHLELGAWDAARVEAVQIDLLLGRLHDGVAPNGGDAFARYLSGIIYEGLGETSNALIAYRKALAAYARTSGLRVPHDLERRMLVYTKRLGLDDEHASLAKRFGERRVEEAMALDGQLRDGAHGELVVVASVGLVPRRYELTSLHQDFTSGKFYRISLPELQPRTSHVNALLLRDGNGVMLARSQPVEDLALAARSALDDELPGLIARAIARNVVKNRVANEAGEESQGLEFLVNFASAMLENADVRSWSTLPERVHLLRAVLPAGAHELDLVFEPGGRPLHVPGTIDINPHRPRVIGVNEQVSRGEVQR